MSIIFGVRKPEGDVVDERQLLDIARATERWAHDGTFVRAKGRIGMGFQPYYTHQRSILQSDPVVDDLGNMVTLDGRLDNHTELRGLLGFREQDTPDSLIVLAAFNHWGEECFSKFVGDWAVAIWSQVDRSLYLARDHAGTRTLYFEIENGNIIWATFLEAFFVDGRSRRLDEAYASCYLACQPILDLTPYTGILAVPPAHYILIRENDVLRKCHWCSTSKAYIKYSTNQEYEEHFFSLLALSVMRRTSARTPVLAHLSGGMDSSSIVCMSDYLQKKLGMYREALIDTVSYYDNFDPAWDETPYFTCVEDVRSKRGIHIDTSTMDWTVNLTRSQNDVLLPGGDNPLLNCDYSSLQSEGKVDYRVVVSGIGGDEFLGGVPTGIPELADCLWAGQLWFLMRRAVEWGLPDRRPFIFTMAAMSRFTFRQYFRGALDASSTPVWLNDVVHLHCREQEQNFSRFQKIVLARPSAMNNGRTWWSVLETQPHLLQAPGGRYEYRYPYLDRDLIDFIFSIPRAQLVAPGRRRCLMRRALSDILPPKILERRRKASLARSPLTALRESLRVNHVRVANFHLVERGLVAPMLAQKEIDLLSSGGHTDHWSYVIRLIKLEHWISNQGSSRLSGFGNIVPKEKRSLSHPKANRVSGGG